MKSRPTSAFVKPLLALAFPFLMAISGEAATISHFDVDFNTYPLGALSTAGTSFSAISNGAGVTASSYTIKDVGTDRVLHVTKTAGATQNSSSITLRTGSPTGTDLKLTTNSTYLWSFDFQAPTNPDQSAFFRLDDGGAAQGRYLAGFRISGGTFSYLTNPNIEALSSQMTAISTSLLSVEAGTWYEVSFTIRTFTIDPGTNPLNLGLSYDISFTRRGESDPAFTFTVPSLLPNDLRTTGNNSVRMGLTFTGTSNDLYIDNLRLQTIPEPVVSMLLISGLGVGAWMAKRRHSRRSEDR